MDQQREHVRAVVDFDAKVHSYIEARIWHAGQKLGRLTDADVQLECEVSDTIQVMSWLLSGGPLACLRAPEALDARCSGDPRADVRDEDA